MNDQNDNLNQWMQENGVSQTPDELVSRFPYFATGHLLKAWKYEDESSKQKAALYFNSSLWLSWLLENDHQILPGLSAETTVTSTEPVVPETPSAISETTEVEPEDSVPEEPDEAMEIKAEPEVFVGEKQWEEKQDDEAISPDILAQEKENLSRLLEEQLNTFKAPVDPTGKDPVASPFFTIDFFASQGIKLSGVTTDHLEGKVKKFTEWLSLLKTKNPNPTDLGTDPQTERIIESIAQSSNHTQEVVTETMAEVLVKQGKNQKAIQLYEKLSFLNPSKSAYFAAKIKELK